MSSSGGPSPLVRTLISAPDVRILRAWKPGRSFCEVAAEGGSGSSFRLAPGPGTGSALGSSSARSDGLGAGLDCAPAALGIIAANAAANPLDVKTRRFMTTPLAIPDQ